MSWDELRAAHPELAFAVYAYEPGGPVTLEVLTPDGAAYVFKAETLDAAIAVAFPPEHVPSGDAWRVAADGPGTDPGPDIFG